MDGISIGIGLACCPYPEGKSHGVTTEKLAQFVEVVCMFSLRLTIAVVPVRVCVCVCVTRDINYKLIELQDYLLCYFQA